MLVTPEGIETEVRPVQSLKVYAPILVTPEGIETEVRPEQPLYLLSVDYQCYTL